MIRKKYAVDIYNDILTGYFFLIKNGFYGKMKYF